MEKNIFCFNHADTPEGWIYIGDDSVRYVLGQPGKCNLVIVGLNPSTATPQEPDLTITKVRKIAELENLDGWIRMYLIEQCQKITDIMSEDLWYTKGVTKMGHPRHPSRIGIPRGNEKVSSEKIFERFIG